MAQTAQRLAVTIRKPIQLDYLLSTPPGYARDRHWPLLLFLHGSGERGSDLDLVASRGIPRLLADGEEMPFLVASPQCPADTIWSVHLDALTALIDDLGQRYAVDPDRIVVTGMSMGGTAAWHLAIAHPHRFAAIAPVCGDRTWYVGDPAQVCSIRHLPVWAFHGEADTVIPASVSIDLVGALRACGADARLTLYPGVGHNCWNQAYSDPELYRWLLGQRRQAAPEVPTRQSLLPRYP